MCLAIPGRIIEIVDEELRLALVDVAGVRRKVNVGLLDNDGEPELFVDDLDDASRYRQAHG